MLLRPSIDSETRAAYAGTASSETARGRRRSLMRRYLSKEEALAESRRSAITGGS